MAWSSCVVYCEQIRVFKAGLRLYTLAWNNKIWSWSYFVGDHQGNDWKKQLWVFVWACQRWNSWILIRRTTAKAFTKDVFINQERKLGDRRWLDTIVVLTINYADKGLVEFRFVSISTLWEITSLWVPGGVWSQGWNLKKLTEGHHQEWSLRLNLTQHGKTYQVQT